MGDRMSWAQVRNEIADALRVIEGVTPVNRRPDAPQIGHAWVNWAESNPLTQAAYDTRWQVFIVLPENPDAAIDATAALVDEVCAAIQTKVYGAAVTSIRPGKLDPSDNAPKVLRFDVRTPTT